MTTKMISEETLQPQEQEETRITPRDLRRVFWRSFQMEFSWNYERQMNLAFVYAQLLQQLGARVMVYGECGQLPGETPLDEPISLSPPLSRVSLTAYSRKASSATSTRPGALRR